MGINSFDIILYREYYTVTSGSNSVFIRSGCLFFNSILSYLFFCNLQEKLVNQKCQTIFAVSYVPCLFYKWYYLLFVRINI